MNTNIKCKLMYVITGSLSRYLIRVTGLYGWRGGWSCYRDEKLLGTAGDLLGAAGDVLGAT